MLEGDNVEVEIDTKEASDKKVDVILYAGAVTPERVSGKSVSVMDVFRATSVLVEALNNGARAVIPVVSIGDACQLAERFDRDDVLLGGERDTVLIEGFDLDNSPRAYTEAVVKNKTIIQTTTNGTRAIHNSRFAHSVFVASFLNIGAVCKELAAQGKDVVLVCAGREDTYTAEDGLCAGAMVNALVQKYGYHATDIAEVMQRMYVDAQKNLKERLSTTQHYNFILERGYNEDIDFCLQQDIYDIVPRYNKKGEVTL